MSSPQKAAQSLATNPGQGVVGVVGVLRLGKPASRTGKKAGVLCSTEANSLQQRLQWAGAGDTQLGCSSRTPPPPPPQYPPTLPTTAAVHPPAPMTSLPRLMVPATSGTCSRLDSSSRSSTLVCGATCKGWGGGAAAAGASGGQQAGRPPAEASSMAQVAAVRAAGGVAQHTVVTSRTHGGPHRTHQAPLVCEGAVAAHQHVAGDGLPEHLHPQHVRHNLLSLLHQPARRGAMDICPHVWPPTHSR